VITLLIQRLKKRFVHITPQLYPLRDCWRRWGDTVRMSKIK